MKKRFQSLFNDLPQNSLVPLWLGRPASRKWTGEQTGRRETLVEGWGDYAKLDTQHDRS